MQLNLLFMPINMVLLFLFRMCLLRWDSNIGTWTCWICWWFNFRLYEIRLHGESSFSAICFQPSPKSLTSSGKNRLILDLSELNTVVDKKKVKFEDRNVMLIYFSKDCFLFKFDLKSGYHHNGLCRKRLIYFSFCWKDQFRYFNVIAIGLTSTLNIFTKC